ncbi:MAG: flagellar export protein FliJ [Betaproteobacteria bacterium]|nr:flagellar export protein FliJ [Betaproteobacteria bacterium]
MARFALQSLLDHALHRLEAAERLLRNLKRKEEEALVQLEALRAYHREYERQFARRGEQGMAIHLLRDYHGFLAKMEQAVRHQELIVDQTRANLKRGQEQWAEQRRKVKAYEAMAARHAARELLKEERRDQRNMDEFANRAHRQRTDDPLA